MQLMRSQNWKITHHTSPLNHTSLIHRPILGTVRNRLFCTALLDEG